MPGFNADTTSEGRLFRECGPFPWACYVALKHARNRDERKTLWRAMPADIQEQLKEHIHD